MATVFGVTIPYQKDTSKPQKVTKICGNQTTSFLPRNLPHKMASFCCGNILLIADFKNSETYQDIWGNRWLDCPFLLLFSYFNSIF